MSKEFKDRLAQGELTDTKDYRRMKEALSNDELGSDKLANDKKEQATEATTDSQEWKNWDLSPVWSSTDKENNKPAVESIRADSVQRALDRMDKI